MSEHSHPDELLQELGRIAVPTASTEQHAELRRRVARNVEATAAREVERRHQVVRWRPRALALAVAAAFVLLPLGWWQWNGRGPSTASSPAAQHRAVRLAALAGSVSVDQGEQGSRSVTGEIDVAAGSRIVTGQDGQARLTLGSGAVATLSGETVLSLPTSGADPREQVDLAAGSSDFSVPKLGPGQGFQVLTPHALVQVRGTRFAVAVHRVDSGAVLATTVRVSEGVVAVTAAGITTLLRAGEEWTSSLAAQSAAAAEGASADEDTEADAEALQRSRSSAAADLQGVAGAAAAARHSTLGAETRLFEQAMSLQRSGRHATALETFELFLSRYSVSPLAQEAQVQRFRLLKRLGQDRAAATAAREYMADHPRGFARSEAKDLALPATTPSSQP
jgi:hypothetical protein